jgi:cytochrome oxidase Cu insertion factor (SCO1/SenC/PrrC family)
MKIKHMLLNIVLLLTLLLAACGGASDEMMDKPEDAMMEEAEATESAMMDKPTEEAMMPHDTPAPDAMVKPTEEAMDDTMMESPAWFNATLTDVQTGTMFTVQDLKGKVMLVEMMAVWCPNCKQQQEHVKELHGLLGQRDDFVSLGLDIDPNETADALKSYVNANGFDWYYAVPPADVSREIASLYGDQFLNPPSTPMLIIDRHGVVHPLPFGIKSADDLLRAVQPFLDEPM